MDTTTLKESGSAAAYLDSTPGRNLGFSGLSTSQYSYITSNIVERLNGTWKHVWHLSSLGLCRRYLVFSNGGLH